jgi:hypothetical protein
MEHSGAACSSPKQKKKRQREHAVAPALSTAAGAQAAHEAPSNMCRRRYVSMRFFGMPCFSWTVCCLDGATFTVDLPDHAPVAEAKRAIGELREVPRYAMELFVKGREEPLEDEERLSSAEQVPLFMLPKPATDRLALESLFTSCGGAGWKRQGGWMTGAALGEWEGVTVDAEGRVTELWLRENNLAGPLPSELELLSSLQVLRLDNNMLTGPVPIELHQPWCGQLRSCCLQGNQLSNREALLGLARIYDDWSPRYFNC